MTTVKNMIKNLQEYDENEHILVLYWSKELGLSFVENLLQDLKHEHRLSDEQMTKLFDETWEYVTDMEYETPDVGDALIDNLREGLEESITELLKEVTDKELEIVDKELWEE
jgi:hypothetical protein